MAEIFDIIDEHDNVIGQASREEAHKKSMLHRIVDIFIFNSKGELLLQKRSEKKDTNPGLWTFSAGGHVEYGETYLEAANKELEEELAGVGVHPRIALDPTGHVAVGHGDGGVGTDQ